MFSWDLMVQKFGLLRHKGGRCMVLRVASYAKSRVKQKKSSSKTLLRIPWGIKMVEDQREGARLPCVLISKTDLLAKATKTEENQIQGLPLINDIHMKTRPKNLQGDGDEIKLSASQVWSQ